MLELDLLRVRATEGQSRGSVIFNPGGPSALGTRHVATQHEFTNRVLEGHYDLVGFDIRGTGRALPFRCDYTKYIEASVKRDVHLPQRDMVTYLHDDGWRTAKIFADQCYEDNKDNGSYISTAFIARDMMAIVDALEEDGLLRFWGASWGTMLGQTFASMFPDKVDKMFLESVMDPEDYMTGLWTHNMHDTDESLDSFLTACVNEPQLCLLANVTDSPTVDSLRSEISELLNDLYNTQEMTDGPGYFSQTWLSTFAPSTRYEDLKNRIFRAVYYAHNFPELDAVLTAALARNFTAYQLPEMPSTEEGSSEDVDLAVILQGAGQHSVHGISCLDGTIRTSEPRELDSYVREQQSSSELADGYMPQFWPCPAWRFEPAERFTGPFTADLKTGILFANGHADPITPFSRAEKVQQAWPGSALLTHGGHGHGVENHKSSCTDQVIRKYFAEGILPTEGTRCEPDLPAFERAYEVLSQRE